MKAVRLIVAKCSSMLVFPLATAFLIYFFANECFWTEIQSSSRYTLLSRSLVWEKLCCSTSSNRTGKRKKNNCKIQIQVLIILTAYAQVCTQKKLRFKMKFSGPCYPQDIALLFSKWSKTQLCRPPNSTPNIFPHLPCKSDLMGQTTTRHQAQVFRATFL